MKISCKMCGANLKYIPSMQKVCCEHCGNSFAPEEVMFVDNMYNELDEYICSSCGATLVANGKTGIIKCIYCGGKEFVNGRVNKEYILDGIIPFEIDREEFIKDCKKHLKELGNVESGFIDKIEEAITIGFYLPYSFANNFFRKQYKGIFNDLLEKILPYNFKDLKKINPIYLDDFVTEIVKTKKEENDIKTNDPSFFWVPVWTANIEYMGEEYYIVMNGQTGEMAGIYRKEVKDDKIEIIRNKLRKIGLIVSILILCMMGIYGVFQYVTKNDFKVLGWFLIIICLMVGCIIGMRASKKDRELTDKERLAIERVKLSRKELMEKGAFTTNKYYKKQK